MSKQMTNWGVGIELTLISSLYAVAMFIAHFIWYPFFIIEVIPYAFFVLVGVILLSIGIPIWVVAGKGIDLTIEEGCLATQGLYGVMRHPIYAQAILFTVPGLVLFFRSWILLTIPLFMYVVFKVLIRKEDRFLHKEFGDAYLQYQSEVNEVLPTLTRLKKAFFYPLATAKIAENTYAVKSRDANLFVYTDGVDTICIDAGYRGDDIAGELKKIGVDMDSIGHLFLTHTDHDHAGGLSLFKRAKVYLGRDDEQMIDGSRSRLLGIYYNPRIEREHTLLDDGEVVRIGDIRVEAIATPGHTPGHMAYLVDGRALFTGDALILQNGVLSPFYRLFNMSTRDARESVQKLAQLEDLSMLCTAHTGYTVDSKEVLKRWAVSA